MLISDVIAKFIATLNLKLRNRVYYHNILSEKNGKIGRTERCDVGTNVWLNLFLDAVLALSGDFDCKTIGQRKVCQVQSFRSAVENEQPIVLPHDGRFHCIEWKSFQLELDEASSTFQKDFSALACLYQGRSFWDLYARAISKAKSILPKKRPTSRKAQGAQPFFVDSIQSIKSFSTFDLDRDGYLITREWRSRSLSEDSSSFSLSTAGPDSVRSRDNNSVVNSWSTATNTSVASADIDDEFDVDWDELMSVLGDSEHEDVSGSDSVSYGPFLQLATPSAPNPSSSSAPARSRKRSGSCDDALDCSEDDSDCSVSSSSVINTFSSVNSYSFTRRRLTAQEQEEDQYHHQYLQIHGESSSSGCSEGSSAMSTASL